MLGSPPRIRGDGMARRKSLKTSTTQEVRKAVSRVINMVLNGELDPKAANSIILGCNSILSTIKLDEQKIKDKETDDVANEWKTALIRVFEKRKAAEESTHVDKNELDGEKKSV